MRKVIVFGVDGLNWPLIKKFTAEGSLPAIQKMLQYGAAAELLPYISAWGDVNWVSFLSGQCPGTSWIGQAMPPNNRLDNNLLAAMEKSGLQAALVHFPETVSVKGENHLEIAPFWGRKSPSPFEISSPYIHTTRFIERTAPRGNTKKQGLGWPPASVLAYHEKCNWREVCIDEGILCFRLISHAGAELVIPITLDDGVLFELQGRQVALKTGEWSEWLQCRLGTEEGFVRFKLLAYDRDCQELELLQSQMMKTGVLSNNPGLEQELAAELGPFITKWTVKAALEEEYLDVCIEEGEYQSFWLADSALKLTQEKGYALWATVHRLVDESHHNCLGQYDPASPFYVKENAEEYCQVMRTCYKSLDRTLVRIMAKMDEETVLMLVSDHGGVPNMYMCDIYRYLEQAGLCARDDKGEILWTRTKAYLKNDRGGLEIFVNLKGREPYGIVPAAEYEQVQEEILHLLGSWHVMEKGHVKNAIGLALKKQDAGIIGFWGDNAGDVIFAYNTGFVWGVSSDGAIIAPVERAGANHGPQKPTAETKASSNYGMIVMYGSGIRTGAFHARSHRGAYKMVDPAVTIARLLRIDPTLLLDLHGSVMFDLLEETMAEAGGR